jgi:hypothetical protein
MANNDSKGAVRKEAPLTPVSDKTGKTVFICVPQWFDERKTYKIVNAPARTASLNFPGSDLNFMARVLYAEASGSGQLTDKAERDKEKSAIMNVNHFRLNRKGYPNSSYDAKTFTRVCTAPGQFQSVEGDTAVKFNSTAAELIPILAKAECADLDEAIAAVKAFMESGPNPAYQFDNFRGYSPNGRGEHIGRSRFWLSKNGKALLDKTP